jgi:hypothetical protein
MLAARITLPHFSVSSAIELSELCGRHRKRHSSQIGKLLT